MIIDYVITTGATSITGCRPFVFETNQDASWFDSYFVLSSEERTGYNDFLLSVNSQTLVSRPATKVDIQFGSVYLTDGDAYFQSGNNSILYYDSSLALQTSVDNNILYDNRIEQVPALGTGLSTGVMITGFLLDAQSKMPAFTGSLNRLDFFLNGQKVYTGDFFTIQNSTGIRFNDNITGKIFAVPQKTGSLQITGSRYDIYGSGFIEKQTNLFIGGMEQEPSLWLELNTGVKTIRTGLSAKIFADSEELSQVTL